MMLVGQMRKRLATTHAGRDIQRDKRLAKSRIAHQQREFPAGTRPGQSQRIGDKWQSSSLVTIDWCRQFSRVVTMVRSCALDLPGLISRA